MLDYFENTLKYVNISILCLLKYQKASVPTIYSTLVDVKGAQRFILEEFFTLTAIIDRESSYARWCIKYDIDL